ncbi:hypothetical protein NEMBOFW57_001517 [Staphylotrichum longicolle]|uniref:Tyrosine specific protein phosphatases domain-containing protein n=1 Tax=Staphylotrichum longicolle TaxID=669026 RepID=A0AAD4I3U9_9PEZI|nr:hypothetical protein NEMBOFW57_001517 [Staphylotrichum longicolle]
MSGLNPDGAAAQSHTPPTTHPTPPSPPFVHVAGADNFRDAGGYALDGQPGKAIRRGVVFRSAHLTDLEDDGVATLQRLGVTHVFDLRSFPEIDKEGRSRAWEGATSQLLPVFLGKDYRPEALAVRFRHYSDGPEGFVKAYSGILSTAAEPDHPYAPYHKILEHLASPTNPPTPLLVHCSAGKDRTGVIIALILSLCGLSDDAVAAEYSLTDRGLARRKEAIVQRLIGEDAPLCGQRARAEMMVGAAKENMLGTLALIRQQYGSVESYVVDHLGVSQAKVDQLRRNLVVDLAEGEEALDWRRHAGSKEEPRL